MRSVALLTILIPFTIGITAANGQRFGTSTTAPRGAVVTLQAAPVFVQTRSGFAPSAVIVPAPGSAFFPAPHVHTQFSVPVVVSPVAPRPHFHPPLVLHHPGVVIIDLPFVSNRTVITQVAPGVVREERRRAETPASEPGSRAPGQLAPFDPTPQEVVERMLAVASLKPGELLYDLGAGDGRVVIAAAKIFGVRAVGFEIDPGLVKLARENVQKQGVENLVEIRQQDLLSADLSAASVVTLYLSYDGNLSVRPKLMSELKPGARVVSYTFDMGNWQAKIAERYRDGAGNIHMIYLWQMGEPLAFR
jgi:precorrin-6B methylase 2